MTTEEQTAGVLARQVAAALKTCECRLVLAESCTGGLLAALFTEIPGISEHFCGSSVTYRNETKSHWLEVSRDDLNNPEVTAVSAQVAEQMCRGLLGSTPEADLAASVTGHLGPHAPAELDGVVYAGVGFRNGPSIHVEKYRLSADEPATGSLRSQRRFEAAIKVLQLVLSALSPYSPHSSTGSGGRV